VRCRIPPGALRLPGLPGRRFGRIRSPGKGNARTRGWRGHCTTAASAKVRCCILPGALRLPGLPGCRFGRIRSPGKGKARTRVGHGGERTTAMVATYATPSPQGSAQRALS